MAFVKTFVMSIVLLSMMGNPGFSVEGSDLERLARGNLDFAITLYRALSEQVTGNLFFSPHSISTALAMTYAGARGNTEREMAEVLGFSMGQERVHAAFAKLERQLNRCEAHADGEMSIANSLWPQLGYPFLPEYLALLSEFYHTTVTPVDYRFSADSARQIINGWVEQQTKDRIQNLIPDGVLTPLTRLVLVNAIYFKGDWSLPFDPDFTEESDFFITPEQAVRAPMMAQQQRFRYAHTEGVQLLELPYAGEELSMIVLLPENTKDLAQWENQISAEKIAEWRDLMRSQPVGVFFPKFTMTSTFSLKEILISMGMNDAFSDQRADFSGMDGQTDWLYIGEVLHKAFVSVSEEGTEAAAATAVVVKERSAPSHGAPPPVFRADRPFLFLIQDNQTRSILFMGRVSDPTKTGD